MYGCGAVSIPYLVIPNTTKDLSMLWSFSWLLATSLYLLSCWEKQGFQPVLTIIGFEPMTYLLLFKERRSAKKEKALSLFEIVFHPSCFWRARIWTNDLAVFEEWLKLQNFEIWKCNVFCCCNFMVAGGWIFIYKKMNVIAIKLTEIACNSFSRSCLVGGHLLYFEFHTVEYIQK